MNVRIFEFTQDTDKNGNVIDWVEYGPKDDHGTRTSCTVKSLIPPENFGDRDPDGTKGMHMNYMWDQIKPAYDAWKDGIALPEYGTALGGWAALNKGQLAALQSSGFKSVEDVRDMPESMISKVRTPGVRALITQAALFLDGQDKATMARAAEEQSSKITVMADEMESMKDKLAAAMELLEEKKPKKAKAA